MSVALLSPISETEFATVLNLGCGNKYMDGALNLDIASAKVSADIRHDLNVRPWPLPSNQFEQVYLLDVIEHLEDVVGTMEEVHRVSSPGAIVRITVPHFSCSNAFTDPTHRHYFGLFSFDYFTGEHEFSFYTDKRFRTRTRQLIFYPSLINKLIWRLANRFPAAYEKRWAWMFPAWFLNFELEVLK
jgi:SAM-dependent methyltransferase